MRGQLAWLSENPAASPASCADGLSEVQTSLSSLTPKAVLSSPSLLVPCTQAQRVWEELEAGAGTVV